MPVWLQITLPLLALLVTVLLFLLPRIQSKSESRRDICIQQLQELGWNLDDRLALERRLTIIENEQKNFQIFHDELLRRLEKTIGVMLHSSHTPDLDRFIDESQLRKLTAEEASEYLVGLEDVVEQAREGDQ